MPGEAPSARLHRPKTCPRSGRAEFTQVPQDAVRGDEAEWGGAHGERGSDRTHLGGTGAAAPLRRASRNRLEPADAERFDHSQGPALATGAKVTRLPLSSGGSWSRLQPQESRARGGGGQARSGGRERLGVSGGGGRERARTPHLSLW